MQCHCRAPCQTNESSWPGRHAARSRAQALQGSNATLTKRTPGPKSWCEKPRVRSGYIYDIYIYHVLICLSYFTPDWDDDPKGLIFLMVQTTNPEGTLVHEPVPRIYAFHKEENPCWTMSCTALCCQIHSHEETPLMPFVNLLKVCWDSGSLKRRIAAKNMWQHTKTYDNSWKHMRTIEKMKCLKTIACCKWFDDFPEPSTSSFCPSHAAAKKSPAVAKAAEVWALSVVISHSGWAGCLRRWLGSWPLNESANCAHQWMLKIHGTYLSSNSGGWYWSHIGPSSPAMKRASGPLTSSFGLSTHPHCLDAKYQPNLQRRIRKGSAETYIIYDICVTFIQQFVKE